MPCCGRSREKARMVVQQPAVQGVQAIAQAVPTSAPAKPGAVQPRPAPPTPAASSHGLLPASVKLRYTGVAAVRVRGSQTGRTYTFSRSEPEAAVDRRDVEGLMRIGLFRRVA
jgi:hypothetical protein